MALFLFIAAVLVSGAYSEKDDPGPYGNYTGMCPLRPAGQDRFIACIPAQDKIFAFGDYIATTVQYPPPGVPYNLTIALMSAKFENLFSATMTSRRSDIHFSSMQLKWSATVFTSFRAQALKKRRVFEGQQVVHKIQNNPEGIEFVSDYKGRYYESSAAEDKYLYKHAAANPATDYKYLIIRVTPVVTADFRYHAHQNYEMTTEGIDYSTKYWDLGQPEFWDAY